MSGTADKYAEFIAKPPAQRLDIAMNEASEWGLAFIKSVDDVKAENVRLRTTLEELEDSMFVCGLYGAFTTAEHQRTKRNSAYIFKKAAEWYLLVAGALEIKRKEE
jgi:hypothetical protein